MTLIKKGDSGAAKGRQPSLEFEIPSGRVRVYYIGQKVYQTKEGPKNKTVMHYEGVNGKRKFATDKPAIVADLAELQKMELPVTATFSWSKGSSSPDISLE